MKKQLQNGVVFVVWFAVIALSSQVFAGPFLKISPDLIECSPGDSILMSAAYIDTSGNEKDTSVTWSVKPNSLGDFIQSDYFIAQKVGEGWIYAKLGKLLDSVAVFITNEEYSGRKKPVLKIQPGHAEIMIGDSLQFQAVYCDTAGLEHDTVAAWSAFPDSIGSITGNGLFYGFLPGESIVTAVLDTLEAWVEVMVFTEDEDDEDTGFTNQHLVVLPKDTLIAVGDSLQFFVYQVSDSGTIGAVIDSVDQWNLLGMPLGSIDERGILQAISPGFALVQAIVGEHTGTALVIVNDTLPDPSGINTITITRTSNSPRGFSVIDTIKEGDTWIIGGLPHPMNILNGGGLFFPVGCLKEDIRIHMNLPDFAKVGQDSVTFGPKNVVSGVDFQVFVRDTLSEPYYFETDLIVGLIYKRGLLNQLGIDPLTLSLFYAEVLDDSVYFDSTGIAYPTLDLTSNRVYSTVAHFSSLVLKGESETVVKTDFPEIQRPISYGLNQNYPNPFNANTIISYRIPKEEMVLVSVYNLTGQLVETLVSERQPVGNYRIYWNAGRYSSGIYIFQIEAGSFTAVRKGILLK
ncbi:T9SS type A sorting domain-containing protein [bacterium]|nr:T9SS type A sorting domain-containing protein [bacterium]